MNTIVQKMIAAGAGLFLTTNVAVCGTLIYSDATTDTGNSLNFVNGTTIGSEVVMAGAASFDTLTSFAFEYYSPDATFSGAVTMNVILSANDGPLNGYGYYDTPGTFFSTVVRLLLRLRSKMAMAAMRRSILTCQDHP